MGKNMKVEMPSINGGGGIKLPKYTEYNVHVFNVYRFGDVIKFLELIDKEEGRLQTVVPSFYPNGLSSGWDITYTLPSYKKELSMEILC